MCLYNRSRVKTESNIPEGYLFVYTVVLCIKINVKIQTGFRQSIGNCLCTLEFSVRFPPNNVTLANDFIREKAEK